MKYLQQYVVILFLLIGNNTFANQGGFDFQLDTTFQYQNIAPFVEVYGDTSLVQDFEFVLENENELYFERNGRKSLHKGVTNAIWWVRFPLKNETTETQSLLLEIGNQDINQLQFFVVRTNRVDSSILTGDAFPFEKRPIQHRHFLFPFELKPQEKVICYLMSNKHSEAYVMPVELWGKKYFLEADQDSSFLNGMYVGILILYNFIPLLLILFFRKKIMVYYFLLSATLTLYILATIGLGFQFLWSDASADFNKVVRPGLTGFQFLFLLLFVIEFLKEKTIFPRLMKILIFGKNLILGLLPLGISVAFYFMGTPYSESLNKFLLSFQFLLIFGLFCIAILISFLDFFKTKSKEVLGIGIVLLAHVATFILVNLNNFAKLNSGPDFHNIMLINVGIEIIVLSIILFSEYWRLSAQKTNLQSKTLNQELKIVNTLLQGQENERFLIAEDLQNQLQPLIAKSQFIFQEEIFTTPSPPVQKVVKLLQKSKEEVNRIAMNLIPPSIYKTDLSSSIQSLCEMINGSKTVQVHFSAKDISATFSIHQRIHIYRIIQELLNNIIKHAQANQGNLVLQEEVGYLKITVDDNGIGLGKTTNTDTSNINNKFGALKYRIQSMNGKIHFSKSELSGLKVEVILPL